MCILNKGSVNSIPEVKNMDKISVVVPCYNEEEALPVYYKEMKLDNGYRMDILVEKQIVLELKSVESLLPIHTAQIMTYLKLSKHHLGLLINFNITNLQNGIKRYVI